MPISMNYGGAMRIAGALLPLSHSESMLSQSRVGGGRDLGSPDHVLIC